MAEKRNLTTKTTIQNLITEQKKVFATITAVNGIDTRLTAAEGKVTTLIGSDANKSVRTIANEELAAQLIPANAGEALDTLQEIAAWIQSHPGDATAMNSAISALQTKLTLGTNGSNQEYATVKAYVEAAIAALNIGDYALAADLTALAGRVTTAEGKITALEAIAPTKVEASATNGNIKIDGTETVVYTLPATVLQQDDIVDYTAAEIATLLSA